MPIDPIDPTPTATLEAPAPAAPAPPIPKPAPAPTVPPVLTEADFAATLKENDAANAAPILSSVSQATDTPPDRAADIQKLSIATGIPGDIVGRNYDAIKKNAAMAAIPAQPMLKDTPALAQWVQNPANAAVAHDDLDKMGALEWLLTMPSRAVTQSINETRYSELRGQALLGDQSQADHDLMASYQYQAEQGAKLGAGDSWFAGAITKGMKLLTSLVVPQMLPAAAGAIGGGLLGVVGGLPGVVAGATLGAEAGYTYGLGKSAFLSGAGAAYDQYSKQTDAMGRPMDPAVARGAALVTGAMNAGLMLFGGRVIGHQIAAGAEGISSAFARDAVTAALKKPSIAASIGAMVRSFGTTLTEGTALNVAMKAADILSDETAKAVDAHDAAQQQTATGATPDYGYGPRFNNGQPGGAPKGLGYLGPLARPDGGVMSEFSIGTDVNGQETEIPAIVPTLSHDDVAAILKMKEGDQLPPGVAEKATAFAQTRLAAGKSVFAGPGEQQGDLYPDLTRAETPAPRAIPHRSGADIAGELVDAGKEGLQSFLLMAAAGPLAGLVHDFTRAQAARSNEAIFNALGEGVAQSKTVQRMPQAAQDYIAQVTRDGPVSHVYAPVDTWTTYWQGQGVDPEKMATELTGDGAAYQQAQQTGGDLAIPTSRYAVKLAGTEHNAEVSKMLRIGPDGMNAADLEQFKATLGAAVDEAQKAPAQAPGPSPVRSAVLDQLTGAGVEPSTAGAYADLYEAGFGTMAERAGADPMQLFKSYGLKVDRPSATFLAHGPDGPLYNIAGGSSDGSTVTQRKLTDLGIATPETPADTGERLNGAQLRAKALAAKAGTPEPMSTAVDLVPPEQRIAQLEAELRSAQRAGETDSLTGVANRVALDKALPLAEADPATSVVMFDANNFGQVNKQVGHEAGDAMLKTMSSSIQQAATEAGIGERVFRRSGDEFVVLAPKGVADQVRARAEELFGEHQAGDATVSLSGTTGDTFARADAQLQTAKQNRKALLSDGAPEPEKSRAVSREGLNAGDGVTASAPRERESASGRVIRETPAERASREREHYDAAFGFLATAARALDPTVNPADLRAEFDYRVHTFNELNSDYVDSGRHPLDLLKAIAKNGGIGPEGQGGLTGELRDLKAGTKFGALNGIAGVFRASQELDDRGAPKTGLGFDVMVQRLQQDPRFAWVDSTQTLMDAIDEAVRNPPAADTFPGNAELKADVNMDPRAAWWRQSWRPGADLLTDDSAIDESELTSPGAGDTSFNVEEFDQSGLFDDEKKKLEPLDPTADTLTTGEVQPRLPGAESVRDQENATPQLEAPFALTSEAAKGSKGKQSTLFQSGPIDDAAVKAFADDVKQRLGADLQDFDVRLISPTELNLERLVVDRGAQRAGLGTDAMRELTKFADAHGMRISLSPAEAADDIGTTSRGRLVTFYKRFGFVENTGRNRDFQLSAGMYREPTLPRPGERPEPSTLEQGDEATPAGKRGAIRFGQDRQVSISLLEKADLSTFLHETGHFFTAVLSDLTRQIGDVAPEARTGGQQQMLDDHATLFKWAGAEPGDTLTVEQHEQIARGFEAYLMEGKAPSVELRPVFARFRAWLVGVYQSLRGLRVNLTPEVRGVMDRLVASDRAIAMAEQQGHIEPMFTTPESAGMSPQEFELYRSTVADASRAAQEQLDTKLLGDVRREQTASWKAQRADIRTDVENETNQKPVYRAIAAMQRGTHPDGSPLVEGLETDPLKLSKKIIVDRYGADRLKRLPKPYVYTVDGGMDPDTVAELFGYSSGDEMLTAISQAPPRDQAIEHETTARMIQQHGSLLLDGTIPEKAQAAVASEQRDAVIRAEMRALGKLQQTAAPFIRAGEDKLAAAQKERAYERRWFEAETKLKISIQKGEDQATIDALTQQAQELRRQARGGAATINAAIPPAGLIKDTAQTRIGAMAIRDLNPATFWSAAKRGSKLATDAAARQDFATAIAGKQQELINLALYREAEGAKEEIATRVAFAKSLSTPAARGRIGLAGEGYLDQIDGILDRFDFAQVSKKALDRRGDLRKWAEGIASTGQAVDLPEELLDESRRRNYQELTVDELRGVTDGLTQIVHLARIKNELLASDARATLSETAGTLGTSIRENFTGSAPTIERDRRNEASRTFGDFIASHRKLASIAREMDGFRDGGPAWEAFARPLNESGAKEAGMNAAAAKALGDLIETAYPRSDKRLLFEKQFIPAIGTSLSKMSRLMVALNWGNEGNRDRVRRGENWTDEQAGAVLNTLDQRDLTLVQGILDHIGSYKDAIFAKQKRVYGVEPQAVEAVPIRTAVGEIPGGYFPLKYDDRLSARAGANLDYEAGNLARLAAYGQATTRRGHTMQRLENVKLPLRLGFGPIFEHVQQVIHDLTHHEALIDIGRVLAHPDVQKAIYETHGDLIYRQMKNTVRDVAFGNIPAVGGFEKGINNFRAGGTVAGLGWSLTTAMLHLSGAVPKSIVRIGPAAFGKGLMRWTRDAVSMENTAAWVNTQSEMMRTRGLTQQREINEIRNVVGVNTGKFSGFAAEMVDKLSMGLVDKQHLVDSYFYLLQQMQRAVDVPTWLGQYGKSMDAGEEPARAIALADQAVLDSAGGGQTKDLAGIQRGNALQRLFTNFYSTFNVTRNLSAEAFSRTNFKSPKSVGRLAVDYLMLYTVPATFGYAIHHAASTSGLFDDAENAAVELAKANVAYYMGTYVGLREFAGAVEGYKDYQGPAGLSVFSALIRAGNQTAGAVKKLAQGVPADEALDKSFWDALDDAGGIIFHYPAGQLNRTIGGLAALMEGQTDNPGALIVGPPPKGSQ